MSYFTKKASDAGDLIKNVSLGGIGGGLLFAGGSYLIQPTPKNEEERKRRMQELKKDTIRGVSTGAIAGVIANNLGYMKK